MIGYPSGQEGPILPGAPILSAPDYPLCPARNISSKVIINKGYRPSVGQDGWILAKILDTGYSLWTETKSRSRGINSVTLMVA